MLRASHAIADTAARLAALVLCILLFAPRCCGKVLLAVLIALLAFVLLGCQTAPARIVDPPVPPPLAVFCSAECLTSCVPEAWPQWTHQADDPKAWDALGAQVIAPLRQYVLQCDAARADCVACLRRIERIGLICGPTVACDGA
jgi:hypothetical protein